MNLWLSTSDLRDYMATSNTTGRYADAPLGSNIRAAQGMLQRETGRLFESSAGTLTFSSGGKAVVSIPDLSAASSVSLQQSALEADTGYWLLPDAHHSGVYVNVQLRPFGSADYRSNPEWFDRNLDQPWARGGYSTPNDLVITGTWGWTSKPDELLMGVKALGAWLTKRADAQNSGAVVEVTGNVMDYTQWPIEAQEARRLFMRGTQMEAV